MSKLLRLPSVSDDGAIYGHVGRYAGSCVMTAFEMMGGVDRLAAWGDANPGEFFTKILPKVISKPVEITASEGVESLLEKLDAEERGRRVAERNATEAEFEEVP